MTFDGFLLADPTTLITCLIAVALVGLSKGGLGGAMGVLGVPLMALVMSPVQAAGILLPVLIVMDWVSLSAWWGKWDKRTLLLMLPGAVVGIAAGWATAAYVDDAMIRLIVGTIAILFVGRWIFASKAKRDTALGHRPAAAWLWSSLAGYTSFVAHAGGPPYQIYAMPLRQDPKIFTGTSVVFFAVVNAVKLVPYFALGQFSSANLMTSAALIPVAAAATFVGAWVVKRMRAEVFYPFMYAMVLLVAVKLIWDGISGLA